MFARLFAVASLAALAVASPAALAVRDECGNGNQLQCCNSVQDANQVSQVFSLFGVTDILAGVVGQVGVHCNPITAIGTGSGAQCTQQTACCSNNGFNGLVNVACSPININA